MSCELNALRASLIIYPFINHIQNVMEDTDDEEENILLWDAIRNGEKPTRISGYVEWVVPQYTATEFRSHFRMSLEAFVFIENLLGPALKKTNETGRPLFNIRTQLLSVIWLLATPDSYRSVGERFNLAKSTLSVCFIRVIKALCTVAPNIIKWPTEEQCCEYVIKFRRLCGIPNVIGAINGTYIAIKAPKINPEVYINRKCHYAMTLQAICNPQLKFIDCYVGYPSSVSDVRIFRNSDIYLSVMANPQGFFANDRHLLGDKAYPILKWLIPPYIDRGNLINEQKHFNTKLSCGRQTIERSFALLKGRFRRLKYLDMNRIDWIAPAILASCVLHNICLNQNETDINEYINEGIIDNDDNQVGDIDHIADFCGIGKRNELANFCNTHHE